MLYKYRSLNDWKFLVDIFVNQRLFAAGFEDLNDPMEGRYYYAQGDLGDAYTRSVREAKRELRVCSLSSRADVPLMWAHYADGHQGVAIGLDVQVDEPSESLVSVRYVDTLDFEAQASLEETAKWILSRKHNLWDYEGEQRVLTRSEFVSVQIHEVLFGCNVSRENKTLLAAFVDSLDLGIAVREYESDAFPNSAT